MINNKIHSELNPSEDLSLYAKRWGASGVPFAATRHSNNKGSELFKTDSIEGAWKMLSRCAELRSFMLLSADNGIGKTALLSSWLQSLEDRRVCSMYIGHASLSACGLLAVIATKLGKDPKGQRARNLALIESGIADLGSTSLVIVLDEAQNYLHSALEEVRLLNGLHPTKEASAFSVVLAGDNYLLNTLQLRSCKALLSRIGCSYQLHSFTPAEVSSYLEWTLQQVGIERSIFEPAAIELITASSGGVARTINLLAQCAWLEASRKNQQHVGIGDVQRAIDLVPSARGALKINTTSSKITQHD